MTWAKKRDKIEHMKIKNIELRHGLFLAPLAGVSDLAFRQICREQGAEYTTTEMISAKAINFKNQKTMALMKIEKGELPAAVQLFGSEADSMSEATKYICENIAPTAIDINMGCPVPKVVGGGDGSALMQNPMLAQKIMRSVARAAEPYGIYATVKIRSGWSGEEKNAPQFAKIAEESGLAAVFIHGRTKSEMYSSPVDLDIIRAAKAATNLPIIGNGGIFTAADAQKMKAQTGCDGVMVARGAFGNPWIFGEIAACFENREYAMPTSQQKLEVIKRHMELLVFCKGEKTALLEARKHLSWYIKGCKNSASAKNLINRSSDFCEMLKILEGALL